MTLRRSIMAGLFGAIGAVAPASAHGIGARGDLPIPKSFFLYAASLAVVLSFFLAAVLWQEPRVGRAAVGRVIGARTTRVLSRVGSLLRTLALVAFVVVLIAAWFGARDSSRNIAPVAVYVVLWIMVLWLCALVGNVWRSLNPWDTLAMYGSGRLGPPPDPRADDGRLAYSHWPAAVGLLAFQWLELAHPNPSDPRVLAVALTAFTVVVLAAAARWGRVWLQTGEAFTVLFNLAGAIAPIGRREDGRLVVRWPFSGLANLPPRRGMAAVVLTVIGGTTFDGISRSRWFDRSFADIRGWDRAMLNTGALALTIMLIALAYLAAIWAVAAIGGRGFQRTAVRFAASLTPIALAYSVAHYFSLAVFEGQSALRLLSDPYGQGWDLFGTADWRTDYRVIGTTTIALVQTAAIVIGHIAGVVLAHEQALRDFGRRRATASQIPMLALMVGLTVTGLTLLLSA